MIRDALTSGVRAATARFSVREASALQAILGALATGVGGSVARGALNAVSPKLLPAFENLGALPINTVRRMISPVQTPADVIVKHLSKASPSHIPPGAPRIL